MQTFPGPAASRCGAAFGANDLASHRRLGITHRPCRQQIGRKSDSCPGIADGSGCLSFAQPPVAMSAIPSPNLQPPTSMGTLPRAVSLSIVFLGKALFRRAATATLLLTLGAWTCVLHASPAGPSPTPTPTESAVRLATVLHQANDPGGRAFAIVDKEAAMLSVFDPNGRWVGGSRVLLGRTFGDVAAPGVGERTERGTLRLADLTTPAGRFVSEPGLNRGGDFVIWVDHATAFAIHRLRRGLHAAERRRRLSQPGASGKRVTAGCVVVPPRFFEDVVVPVLGNGFAVVYVLPEQPEVGRKAASFPEG